MSSEKIKRSTDGELIAPLRAARRQAEWTLADLVSSLRGMGVNTSKAWISRIERGGDCMCSPTLAKSITKAFAKVNVPLTEIQIIYPERYRQRVQVRRSA